MCFVLDYILHHIHNFMSVHLNCLTIVFFCLLYFSLHSLKQNAASKVLTCYYIIIIICDDIIKNYI